MKNLRALEFSFGNRSPDGVTDAVCVADHTQMTVNLLIHGGTVFYVVEQCVGQDYCLCKSRLRTTLLLTS